MDRQRISHALQRINGATNRIELAVASRPADIELERRHAALRAEATVALAELDRLIGQLEG